MRATQENEREQPATPAEIDGRRAVARGWVGVRSGLGPLLIGAVLVVGWLAVNISAALFE